MAERGHDHLGSTTEGKTVSLCFPDFSGRVDSGYYETEVTVLCGGYVECKTGTIYLVKPLSSISYNVI